MEKITIAEETILPFYDEFGSKHFQLQSKVLERFGTLKLDMYFKSVGFVSSVLGIVGVIAGFGFTAFSSIQNKPLFFLSEFILVGGIFRGVLWIQSIYTSEHNSLNTSFEKYKKFFEERNEVFMVVYNQLIVSPHEVNKKDMESLMNKDKESLALFKPEETKEESQTIYSKEVYWSLVFGTVLLFTSFFFSSLKGHLLDMFTIVLRILK